MNYPKNRYSGPKPWMDYEWLYDQYITKDRSTIDIATEFGCKRNTIQCWLLKHGIKKDFVKRNRKKKTVAAENKPPRKKKYTEQDIDEMVRLYCDEMMSANQISKLFHTDHNTIIRKLKRRGISTRGMIDAQYAINGRQMPEELKDPELMRKLHWDDKMTCSEIGKLYGVDAGSVRRQLRRIGVPTKTNSESKIGLMTGEKHHNWKGGITPLYLLLREYFHVNQAPAILKRDNYTCQLCGKTHTALHVHHITEFSIIVSEIMSEHPHLNPLDIDDREELYGIITNDSRFLDNDNLITLCKECHLFIIHNYTHKTISSQAQEWEGSETIR